jgi:hypothetical protein
MSSTSSAGATLWLAMNCATSPSCGAQACAREARFSSRLKVGAEASNSSRPIAVCISTSPRSAL